MRLTPIPPELMSAAQRDVCAAALSGRRGTVPAPLGPWLRSPAMAMGAQRFGESIRFDLDLPPRLLAILALTVASHWKAAYVQTVQRAKAVSEGVGQPVIDAIEAGRDPPFSDAAAAATYWTVQALLDRQRLDDEEYARGSRIFGERGVVELVAAFGYYTLVSVTASVFEIDVP